MVSPQAAISVVWNTTKSFGGLRDTYHRCNGSSNVIGLDGIAASCEWRSSRGTNLAHAHYRIPHPEEETGLGGVRFQKTSNRN